jgi:hypothetical protein
LASVAEKESRRGCFPGERHHLQSVNTYATVLRAKSTTGLWRIRENMKMAQVAAISADTELRLAGKPAGTTC